MAKCTMALFISLPEQDDTPADSKPPRIPEKEGSSLKRFIIFSVVADGGLAGGPPPVFLWDCIIPEFVFLAICDKFAIYREFRLVYAFHIQGC